EAQLDDGRWMHISERRTKDGGYVSVGTDITKLKLHEQKLVEGEKRQMATIYDLRKSQQALERQTGELADLAGKYAEEKTRAEEANQTKSKFLANMSHELRTPLNAIIGYSEILQEDAVDLGQDNLVADLKKIESAGRHLLGLINDILDLSKIEAGRLDIYRNQVKLPDLIEQLELMFREQAAEKGIRFTCHVHNRLPEQVITDEQRLRQILINLLSTAIKYT
ncbi:PAS domain-containing sensor histidine kinase, partial [Lacticaseibacillus rhamnosus]